MSPSERVHASSSKYDWRAGGSVRGGGGGAGAGAVGARMRVGARASSLSPMRGAALTSTASRATPLSPAFISATNSTSTAPAVPTVTSTTLYDPLHRISSPSRRRDFENFSKERLPRGRTPRRGKNPSDHVFRTRKSTISTACPISRINSQTDRPSISYVGWMLGAQERPKKDTYITRRNASPGVARALDWRPEVPWVESRRLSKGRSWSRRIPGLSERSRARSMFYHQHRTKKMKSMDTSQAPPLFQPRGEMEAKDDNRQQMKRYGSECVLTATYKPSSGFLDDLKISQRKKSKQTLIADKRKPNKSSSEIQLSAARASSLGGNAFEDLIKSRKDKQVKQLVPKLETSVKKEKRRNKSSERSLRKDTKSGTHPKGKTRKRREESFSAGYNKTKLKHDFNLFKKELHGNFGNLCNVVMYHSPSASVFFPQMSSFTLDDLNGCISATSYDSFSEDYLGGRVSRRRFYDRQEVLAVEKNDNLRTSQSRFNAFTPPSHKTSEVFPKHNCPLCTVKFSNAEIDELMSMQDKLLGHRSQITSNTGTENEDETNEDKTNLSSHLIFSDTTIPSCEDVFRMSADKNVCSSSESLNIENSVNATRLPKPDKSKTIIDDISNVCMNKTSEENIKKEVEGVKITLEGTMESLNANLYMQPQFNKIPESPVRFEEKPMQMYSIKEEDTDLSKSKNSPCSSLCEKPKHQTDEIHKKIEILPIEKETSKPDSAKSRELASRNGNESDDNLNGLNISCHQLDKSKSRDEIRSMSLGSQHIKTESNAQENFTSDRREISVPTEKKDQEGRDEDKMESKEKLKKSLSSSREITDSSKTVSPQASCDSEISTWTSISSLSGRSSDRYGKKTKFKGKGPLSISETDESGPCDEDIVYDKKSFHSKLNNSSGDQSDAKKISCTISRNSKSLKQSVAITPTVDNSTELIESIQDFMKSTSLSCRSLSRNVDEISEKQGAKHSREPENKNIGSCVICDVYLNASCDSSESKEKKETKDVEIQNPSLKSEITVDHQQTFTNISLNSFPTDTLNDVVPETSTEAKPNGHQTGSKPSQTTSLYSQTSKCVHSSNATNFDTSFGIEKYGRIIPAHLTRNHYKELHPFRWYSFSNIGIAKSEQKLPELCSPVSSNLPKREIKPIITSPDHSISEKQNKNRIGARVFHTKPKANLKPRNPFIFQKRLLLEDSCQNKSYANTVNHKKNEKTYHPSFLHLHKTIHRIPASLKPGHSRSKLKIPVHLVRATSILKSTSSVHTQTDWVIPPARAATETKMLPNRERQPLCSTCLNLMSKNGLQQMKSSNFQTRDNYTDWLDSVAKRVKHTSPNLQAMFKCEKERLNTFHSRAPEKAFRDVKRSPECGSRGEESRTRPVFSHPSVPLRSTRSIYIRPSRGYGALKEDDHSQRPPLKVRFADATENKRFNYSSYTSSQSSIHEDVSRSQVLSDTFGRQQPPKDGDHPLRLRDATIERCIPPSTISLSSMLETSTSTEKKPSVYPLKRVSEYTKRESQFNSLKSTGAEKQESGSTPERKNRRYKIGSFQKYSSSLGSHLHHVFKTSVDVSKPFKSIVCVPRGDGISDGIRKPLTTPGAKKPVDVAPKTKSDFFKAIKFPIWHL